MPQSLQGDVSLSLYKTMIDKVRKYGITLMLHSILLQVPLFQNTEIGFTKLLAMSIKPVLYLSNEYIVQKGDHGSEVQSITDHTSCTLY